MSELPAWHLEYLLRESEKGIRTMLEARALLHVFDYGRDKNGVEWCFVMAILPKTSVSALEEKLGEKLKEY